jgi:hypothetical protein
LGDMQDQHRVDEDLCFIMMPFDTSFAGVHQTIKGVVKDYAGVVKCVRADEISRSTRITDDILDYIRRARFLVADLTGSNPNVFYEVGASRALEQNVILLLQEGSEAPFDIREIRYIRYSKSNLPDLAAKLKDYVRGWLRTIPAQWPTSPTIGRPDVRISHLDYPHTAIAGQHIRITVRAKNFGTAAEQAYVSLSFPSESADMRTLGSDINVKPGKKGDGWKACLRDSRTNRMEGEHFSPDGSRNRCASHRTVSVLRIGKLQERWSRIFVRSDRRSAKRST